MFKELKIELFWLTQGEEQESCRSPTSHSPLHKPRGYTPSAAAKPISYAGHSLNYTCPRLAPYLREKKGDSERVTRPAKYH